MLGLRTLARKQQQVIQVLDPNMRGKHGGWVARSRGDGGLETGLQLTLAIFVPCVRTPLQWAAGQQRQKKSCCSRILGVRSGLHTADSW